MSVAVAVIQYLLVATAHPAAPTVTALGEPVPVITHPAALLRTGCTQEQMAW